MINFVWHKVRNVGWKVKLELIGLGIILYFWNPVSSSVLTDFTSSIGRVLALIPGDWDVKKYVIVEYTLLTVDTCQCRTQTLNSPFPQIPFKIANIYILYLIANENANHWSIKEAITDCNILHTNQDLRISATVTIS